MLLLTSCGDGQKSTQEVSNNKGIVCQAVGNCIINSPPQQDNDLVKTDSIEGIVVMEYANGEMPVENVKIFISGMQPVFSNSKGEFKIYNVKGKVGGKVKYEVDATINGEKFRAVDEVIQLWNKTKRIELEQVNQ